MVTRLISQGAAWRRLLGKGEMLVGVDVVPTPMVFQLSCCTSDPVPTKQGFCLSRLGAAGSGLHLTRRPEKRGLPGWAVSCRATQFVDFSQEAVVGTQHWDINPLSRLFLKLQREIKVYLITSLFSGIFTSKEKMKMYNGFPGGFNCPSYWRFTSNFKSAKFPQSLDTFVPFSWEIRWYM